MINESHDKAMHCAMTCIPRYLFNDHVKCITRGRAKGQKGSPLWSVQNEKVKIPCKEQCYCNLHFQVCERNRQNIFKLISFYYCSDLSVKNVIVSLSC